MRTETVLRLKSSDPRCQDRAAGLNAALCLVSALLPFVYVLIQGLAGYWLPSSTGWTTITLYDWQRISAIAILVTSLGLSLIASRGRVGDVHGRVAPLIVIGVLLTGVVSVVVNGRDAWSGLREVGNVGLLMFSFWSLCYCLKRGRAWQPLVLACLMSSALLYLLTFLDTNSYALLFPEFRDLEIVFPAFSNVRFFSDYQAFLLPFVICLTVYCRSSVARIAAWISVWLFVMLFFYTGSRVVLLGQAGAHFLLWIAIGRNYKPTFGRHLLAWAGGYAAFLFFSQLLPYLLGGGVPTSIPPLLRGSLSLRETLWALAWSDIVAHPWLGIGPGEFSRQLNMVASAPHNGLLMLGAEWGMPVMFIAVAAAFRFCWLRLRFLRSMTKDGPSDFSIATWLAFSALLFHSLVANVWVVPTSQVAVLLSAALFHVAIPASISPGFAAPQMQGIRYVWTSAAVALCLWMTTVLILDVPALPARNKGYVDCPRPTPFFSPRFWQQGWLIDGCLMKDWARFPAAPAR